MRAVPAPRAGLVDVHEAVLEDPVLAGALAVDPNVQIGMVVGDLGVPGRVGALVDAARAGYLRSGPLSRGRLEALDAFSHARQGASDGR